LRVREAQQASQIGRVDGLLPLPLDSLQFTQVQAQPAHDRLRNRRPEKEMTLEEYRERRRLEHTEENPAED